MWAIKFKSKQKYREERIHIKISILIQKSNSNNLKQLLRKIKLRLKDRMKHHHVQRLLTKDGFLLILQMLARNQARDNWIPLWPSLVITQKIKRKPNKRWRYWKVWLANLQTSKLRRMKRLIFQHDYLISRNRYSMMEAQARSLKSKVIWKSMANPSKLWTNRSSQ